MFSLYKVSSGASLWLLANLVNPKQSPVHRKIKRLLEITQPIVTYIFLQEIPNMIIRLSSLTWCFKRSSSVVPLNNKVQFKMQKKYQAPEKLQKCPCCDGYFSPWILIA